MVNYFKQKNVDSTGTLPIFVSFGGYGYDGNLIFDLMGYLSIHEFNPEYYSEVDPNPCEADHTETISQPGLALSLKYSPLKGRFKPYAGISGSITSRKAVCVKVCRRRKGSESSWRKSFSKRMVSLF